MRNVFACPLKVGVYIDQCTDIGRIENVHFNPNFWTRMALKPGVPGGDIKVYLEKNLVGFKVGETDWEFISNSFVIFPRIGFHFDDFGHGPGNAVITQSGSDICPVALRVDRTQAHAGVQIANGQFMSTLQIGAQNRGPVKLTNCGCIFRDRHGVQDHSGVEVQIGLNTPSSACAIQGETRPPHAKDAKGAKGAEESNVLRLRTSWT